MKMLIEDGGSRTPISNLSFPQMKQSAAIMDCLGRLIPQEGVDYDIEIVFKGKYSPNVSINIVPMTDKGEWWKGYVSRMISRYPPTVENPEPSIPIETEEKEENVKDEEVMS